MRLAEVRGAATYHIVDSHANGRSRARLDSLGLVPGATIRVLSANWTGLIIGIKGSRLALSRSVAGDLEVESGASILPRGEDDL